MDLAELRGLSLFDGLDDAQLGDAPRRGHRAAASVAGEVLFHEGRPADTLVGAPRGHAWRSSAGSAPRTSMLGDMTTPGQWAGGFAAWDEFGIYLATGRAEIRRAGAAALLDRAASPVRAVVPVRAALHRRPGQHRAPDRVHGPPARGARRARHPVGRPGARAEQPGIRGHPRRRRAPADLGPALESLARLARRRHHRGAVRRASTGCGRRISGTELGAHRARPGRPRGRARPTGSRTTTSTATGCIAPVLAARGRRRRVVRGAGRGRARRLARPRPGVGLGVGVDRTRCSARSRRPPAASRTSSRPCGRTPRWTAPRSR